jgi:hypothetical protein
MRSPNYRSVLFGLAALALWLTPAVVQATDARCLILSLTSMTCPGCGGTRALDALFRGDVAVALHFNPYVTVLTGLVLSGCVISLAQDCKQWRDSAADRRNL